MTSKVLFIFSKDDYEKDFADCHEDTLELYMIKQHCQGRSDRDFLLVDSYENVKADPGTVCIPVGSVSWCSNKYGDVPPIDYPDFLKPYLHRRTGLVKATDVLKKMKENKGKLFLKPANKCKKFNGTVVSKRRWFNFKIVAGIKDDECLKWSQVVEFTNEWRYYVKNGRLVNAQYYEGREPLDDPPFPPDLPAALKYELFARSWCGCIDMGTTKESPDNLVLVEACLPYAIGWYGDQDSYDNYAEFLIGGDKYMCRKGNI